MTYQVVYVHYYMILPYSQMYIHMEEVCYEETLRDRHFQQFYSNTLSSLLSKSSLHNILIQ